MVEVLKTFSGIFPEGVKVHSYRFQLSLDPRAMLLLRQGAFLSIKVILFSTIILVHNQ